MNSSLTQEEAQVCLEAGAASYRQQGKTVAAEALLAQINAASPRGLAGLVSGLLHGPGARRAFFLDYRQEADALERWQLLNHALAALARSERLWCVTTPAHGRTRGAAAPSLVRRTTSTFRQQMPDAIAASVTPYCLDIGERQFFFFPDRLYVQQNGAYETVTYPLLTLNMEQTRFVEEEQVPRDARIVGHQWRYTDKFGGPDHRIKNNERVPIAHYAVLDFSARSGLQVRLHVSSPAAAEEFAGLFRFLQGRDAPQPRPAPPAADSHKRLGLPESCTQGEAAARYRQLVMANHPDRMSHRPAADHEAANAQLQEIIHAYRELKRLRGW